MKKSIDDFPKIWIPPGQEPPQKRSAPSPKQKKASLLEKVLSYQDTDNPSIQSRQIEAPAEVDIEEQYQLAREDFLRFAIAIDEFPVARIHIDRDKYIKTHDRAVIIGPQGHGKTTLESILRQQTLV